MVAHCLFEQSGTFKNEFIKMGFDALDYDIQNEFGQTDVVCDLFQEINNAFEGGWKAPFLKRLKKKILFLLSSLAQDLKHKFIYGFAVIVFL